ncbi:Trp biosynthesis-associated membrane protein [Luteimicrobium subarcticum]|uniref:Tryptophan-associated transmembrane protein n=1 Tax=Luteimicrobium subarcticum TaxID=620910 RepID=A0A2M8W3G9_9MICO|nr:Trp biosynthesis-associated membrane protein [Luteimicrobium subarcticum]PJI85473.1 tryptophan-associated transmembrane protein [Luteimicrobium subarcticum]
MSRRVGLTRLDRRTSVLTLLLLGLLALGTAVPTWLTSAGSTAISAHVAVTVAGTKAAPGVAAGALVVAAGALALGIVGRLGRYLVPVVTAVAGVVVTGAAVGVLRDPRPVAVRAAADTTGVTVLIEPVHVSVWPWLTAVLGVLVVVVSVLALVGARTWTFSTRHERAGTVAPPTAAASTASGTADTAPGAGDGDGGSADAIDADDHHAVWDSLSRGEDPTDRPDA